MGIWSEPGRKENRSHQLSLLYLHHIGIQTLAEKSKNEFIVARKSIFYNNSGQWFKRPFCAHRWLLQTQVCCYSLPWMPGSKTILRPLPWTAKAKRHDPSDWLSYQEEVLWAAEKAFLHNLSHIGHNFFFTLPEICCKVAWWSLSFLTLTHPTDVRKRDTKQNASSTFIRDIAWMREWIFVTQVRLVPFLELTFSCFLKNK